MELENPPVPLLLKDRPPRQVITKLQYQHVYGQPSPDTTPTLPRVHEPPTIATITNNAAPPRMNDPQLQPTIQLNTNNDTFDQPDNTMPAPEMTPTNIIAERHVTWTDDPPVPPITLPYTKTQLMELPLNKLKEICHQMGVRTRTNSILSSLVTEILRIQDIQNRMLHPGHDRRVQKKTTKAMKTTSNKQIYGWELLAPLPSPTSPTSFKKEYWHEHRRKIRQERKAENTSWGWNNEYAKTVTSNEFTYRDHSKPKYNYRQES